MHGKYAPILHGNPVFMITLSATTNRINAYPIILSTTHFTGKVINFILPINSKNLALLTGQPFLQRMSQKRLLNFILQSQRSLISPPPDWARFYHYTSDGRG